MARSGRRYRRRPHALLAAALCCAGAAAQEGYPLDGTWRGTWGEADPEPVVLVMEWNGRTITGMIDPGPNALPFESAALDPATWSVRIESESADGAPIVIRARLEDIGSYHRTLTGTWTQGGEEYEFRAERQ